MKELFLPYQLALLAKEKEFDDPCLAFYEVNKNLRMIWREEMHPIENSMLYKDEIAAPLYQQIIDWFRKKYNITIEISSYNCYGVYIGLHFKYLIYKHYTEPIKEGVFAGDYYEALHEENENTNYYQSLNKAIEEAFKLI